MEQQIEHGTTTAAAAPQGIRAWFTGLDPRWRKGFKYAAGVVLGGAAGFAVYAFTGCETGGCSLSRDPYVSTMIGAVMGVLFADGK